MWFSVDGQWGAWASWTSCNVTCGGGSRTRSRSCDNPKPTNGGKGCSGTGNDMLPCGDTLCPSKLCYYQQSLLAQHLCDHSCTCTCQSFGTEICSTVYNTGIVNNYWPTCIAVKDKGTC